MWHNTIPSPPSLPSVRVLSNGGHQHRVRDRQARGYRMHGWVAAWPGVLLLLWRTDGDEEKYLWALVEWINSISLPQFSATFGIKCHLDKMLFHLKYGEIWGTQWVSPFKWPIICIHRFKLLPFLSTIADDLREGRRTNHSMGELKNWFVGGWSLIKWH